MERRWVDEIHEKEGKKEGKGMNVRNEMERKKENWINERSEEEVKKERSECEKWVGMNVGKWDNVKGRKEIKEGRKEHRMNERSEKEASKIKE